MADPRFDEENAALKARIEQVLTQSEEERFFESFLFQSL